MTGPSAAIEPEPDESEKPVEREYEVTGVMPVFGNAHGETFKRVIPLKQEARLLKNGALKRKSAKAGGQKRKSAKAGATKGSRQKPASKPIEKKE